MGLSNWCSCTAVSGGGVTTLGCFREDDEVVGRVVLSKTIDSEGNTELSLIAIRYDGTTIDPYEGVWEEC